MIEEFFYQNGALEFVSGVIIMITKASEIQTLVLKLEIAPKEGSFINHYH